MREAKLISTGPVPVADIDDKKRLRPVSEAALAALIESINTVGVMKDEVIVRRVKHQGGKLVLIAGGHRMEAARQLGWETIPAKIYDCADDWAELMEIDDNLAHAELSALEMATFMSARKAAFLRVHPEAAHGGDRGNQHTGGRQVEMISFCQTIAEKRGMSERHVRNFARIGAMLTPDTVALLRGRQVKYNDLDALARIEGAEQVQTANILATGSAKNVKAALLAARGLSLPPVDKVDAAYRKMIEGFERAPKAAQRRFIEDLASKPGFALMMRAALDQGEAA